MNLKNGIGTRRAGRDVIRNDSEWRALFHEVLTKPISAIVTHIAVWQIGSRGKIS